MAPATRGANFGMPHGPGRRYPPAVTHRPYRYQSPDEDSGRWIGFPFRSGDIVISTRSKCGTTWTQMICGLLIFGEPRLPAPLARLSPWLDWLIEPRDDVHARLAAQTHRRFIKTHTPLDGLPYDERVTYLVVGRHPLDMAVSLYHQVANIDRVRQRQLLGAPDQPVSAPTARPPLRDWLLSWIDHDGDPRQELDSLAGVMWHMSDAWSRRHQPNVLLLRYEDLVADLDGQMRRIADRLGITVPADTWPRLVEAATFTRMRANARELAPDPAGILKDPHAFFRRGTPGAGRELLTEEEHAHYHRRAAALGGQADMLAWLHGEPAPPQVDGGPPPSPTPAGG